MGGLLVQLQAGRLHWLAHRVSSRGPMGVQTGATSFHRDTNPMGPEASSADISFYLFSDATLPRTIATRGYSPPITPTCRIITLRRRFRPYCCCRYRSGCAHHRPRLRPMASRTGGVRCTNLNLRTTPWYQVQSSLSHARGTCIETFPNPLLSDYCPRPSQTHYKPRPCSQYAAMGRRNVTGICAKGRLRVPLSEVPLIPEAPRRMAGSERPPGRCHSSGHSSHASEQACIL